MILHSLSLASFRSYAKKSFNFSPQTTLIVGPNASGKTNLLEAITLVATARSFRADQDREMITLGSELSRIGAEVVPLSGTPHVLDKLKLELVLTTGQVQGQRAPLKKYLINGVPRRQVDFVGNLRAVLFWPEDLELVTDSPSLRRKYLNSVLVQVDREYRRNLLSYERGLRQRNRLLDLINEGKADRRQLLFWDQLLIRTGAYLTDKRAEYIDFVNSSQLSALSYQLQYDKSVISEARLAQYAEEEVAAKATLVGPHRDDFIVKLRAKEDNFIDLSKFGSRGEQRLAVLWLKLAELAFIEKKTHERPLLLLDDIFSELDKAHREFILALISRQQTIITSADEETIGLLSSRKIKDLEIVRLPLVH